MYFNPVNLLTTTKYYIVEKHPITLPYNSSVKSVYFSILSALVISGTNSIDSNSG